MGWQSHSKVVRVSPDRLKKLIKAAQRTRFSHRLGAVWIEHVLDGKREIDITDMVEADPDSFPCWFKDGCDLMSKLFIRGSRVILVKDSPKPSICNGPSEECSCHWEAFKACPLNIRPDNAAAFLTSKPPLPTGLLKVLHAADISMLAGTSKQLHYLSHDMVSMEQKVLEVRLPAWKGRMGLKYHIEERIRTLLRGNTVLESVCCTYKDRQTFTEDLQNMSQSGQALVCGEVVHAGKEGAKPGWFATVKYAQSPDKNIGGDIGAALVSADALTELSGEHFWQKDGMRVCVRFSMSQSVPDAIVQDMGPGKSTDDFISSVFPSRFKIRGGSHEPSSFCSFYAMSPDHVEPFLASLMQPAAHGEDSKTLKQLQALVFRASLEGEGLFMEQMCC